LYPVQQVALRNPESSRLNRYVYSGATNEKC